ncbi:MAG: TetR/AcrR family transcriptional regulator, partial [Pseudomonadota bacterium]
MAKERTTREKLIFAATDHFRRKGYAAAGLTEILEAAGVPKGSLYHHFPGGKPDLALATAEWAGRYLSRMMDEAFEESASFGEGVRRIAGAIADIHDA